MIAGVGTQNAGIGIRGGYTLSIEIYVGAAFVYHLGGSKEQDRAPSAGIARVPGRVRAWSASRTRAASS